MRLLRNGSELVIGLMVLYFLSTLVSTAVMSAGFGLLTLTFLGMPNLPFRLKEIWRTPLTRRYLSITLGLISILFLSSVFALFRNPPLYDHPLDVKLAQECKKLLYFFTPLMIFSVFSHLPKNEIRKPFKAYWTFLGFLSIVGVIQFYTGWPRQQQLASGYFSAILFMGLSLSVSSVLSLAFFPLLSYWIQSTKKRSSDFLRESFFPTWAAGLVSAGVALTIFLTFSRMSLISLPLGVLLLLMISLGRKTMYSACIAIVVALGLIFSSSQSLRDRMTARAGYTDRLELWKGHLELFQMNPIIGVGFRQNAKLVETVVKSRYERMQQPVPQEFFGSHAHNNWIEVLAGAGLLGFLMFAIWNYFILRMLLSGRKGSHSWWFIGALVGFFVFHFNGLTQVNFWDSKVLHSLMLVVGVSLFFSTRKPEQV